MGRGRLQAAKEFLEGCSAGILQEKPPADATQPWMDGWAESRGLARDLVSGYLQQRGYDPLRDITIKQVLQ